MLVGLGGWGSAPGDAPGVVVPADGLANCVTRPVPQDGRVEHQSPHERVLGGVVEVRNRDATLSHGVLDGP